MTASPGPVVALIGLRCAGKTSVGEALARRLGWPFVDLDRALAGRWAAAAGVSPTPPAGEVLTRLGEDAFRELELAELVGRLAAGGPLVLATGGGAVLSAAGRAALARAARCVWLDASPDELARRLRADAAPRPSLTGGDPADELVRLAADRVPLYRRLAALRLPTEGRDVAELVDRIVEELGLE